MTVALLNAHRIQAGDITANAVTSDKIAANAIGTDKLAANAVTSDKIVANAITSDKILANSVTTGKLKVTEDMTVALLKAHKIQAGELDANSVTGQNIRADALYGKTIQGGVFRTSDGRMVINDAGIVAKSKTSRKRQAYYTYWQGEPNNSPSVLVTVDLDADETFVLDSQSGTVALCGEILSGSTISGTSIVGSEFRTANSRMLLNDSGLVLRNVQGKATVTLDAASGNATFTGTVTGSTITGGTVSGAVITGSAFTSPDGKTKLNSSGFYVGDKLAYDAKTGLLSLKGSIQSGSDLSGVTVTGSTIQTSSVANRGLKLTSGGLVAYDGNGNAKFTLKSDGTIQMNGALMTNGKLTAATLEGGTITGGTITGGTIQSSTAANTGFKLTGGALDFYDKSNNRTVHLNGTDNLLSGTFQTRTSGHRVRISPDYQSYIIGGTETFVGDGLEFPAYNGSTVYYQHPTVASAIQSNQVGSMSELDLWSGHVTKNDPAAFLRLQSKPRRMGGTGSGGVTSTVKATANTDYDEPDMSKKSSATLTLTGDSANGSEFWLHAQDANGYVGVGANIATGYLSFGGFLSGITNRQTFQGAVAWKAWFPNPGQSIATGASAQVTCQLSPAKYGRYYAVANADSEWAGIIAHPCYTGGQSGFTLKLYNADQPCPVDVYAEYLAYLVK